MARTGMGSDSSRSLSLARYSPEKRIEHAAERAHQAHAEQPKQGEVQPVQPGLVQASAQTIWRDSREHAAENAHHQQRHTAR